MTADEARALYDAKIENPEFVDIPACVKEFIDVIIYQRIFRDNSNTVRIQADTRRVNPSDPVACFITESMDVVAKFLEQQGFKVERSDSKFILSINIEW